MVVVDYIQSLTDRGKMKKLRICVLFVWMVFWLLLTYPFFWVSAITFRVAGLTAKYMFKRRLHFGDTQCDFVTKLINGLVDDYKF